MNTAPRIAAIVAGVAYLALGAVSLTGSVPEQNWGTRGAIVNLLGLIGFGATVVAAERLRTPLSLSRVGVGGVRAAQLGLAAMTIESVASQLHGGNTLGPVFFIGLLLTLVGFLVAGVDGLRRPGARWVALLPFLGLLVGVGAGEHGGFLVLGTVWLVLAFASVGQPMTIPAQSLLRRGPRSPQIR